MSAPATDVVLFDPAAIELATDPREVVLRCCEQGKAWLAYAVEHRPIEQIVQQKSQAKVLEELTKQMRLGKEASLSATELVRSAERAIAAAIRAGQEAGEIRRAERHGIRDADSMSPHVAAGMGRSSLTALYAMTDGVPDEQFDIAIAEAKAEGNLSQANVIRKISGAAPQSRSVRPDVLRNTHHIQPAKIIDRTVVGLEGFCMSVALLELEHYEGLDPADVEEWSSSLRKSLRSLNQFAKELNHARV